EKPLPSNPAGQGGTITVSSSVLSRSTPPEAAMDRGFARSALVLLFAVAVGLAALVPFGGRGSRRPAAAPARPVQRRTPPLAASGPEAPDSYPGAAWSPDGRRLAVGRQSRIELWSVPAAGLAQPPALAKTLRAPAPDL